MVQSLTLAVLDTWEYLIQFGSKSRGNKLYEVSLYMGDWRVDKFFVMIQLETPLTSTVVLDISTAVLYWFPDVAPELWYHDHL